jgi:hypothetical protein
MRLRVLKTDELKQTSNQLSSDMVFIKSKADFSPNYFHKNDNS